jgi:hypothetical protein
MIHFNVSRPKSWQSIAEQIQKETDPKKICQLSRELIVAIDSQVGPVKKRPHSVKLDRTSAESATHS